VLMGCELPELAGSVGLLSRGLRYLCPSAARRVAESLTRQCLTAREADVLHLMIKGCSNKVIARELDIAVGTVKAHVKAVLAKLDVGTRLQAVAAAAERGLGVAAGVQVAQPRPKVVAWPTRLSTSSPSQASRNLSSLRGTSRSLAQWAITS